MKKFVVTIFVLFNSFVFSQTPWQQTNGLYGGSVYSIIKSGDNLFVGCYGGGVYLSTNNGDTWIEKNNGVDKSVYALAVLEDKLFAATRNGLYLSGNLGDTWTKITNGLPEIWIYSLDIVDSLLFAGTWGDGIYRSTDKGFTWNSVSNGLTPKNIYCVTGKGEDIYCGTFGGGIYHSTNRGDNWTQASNGIGDMYTYTLAINNDTIYAGQYNSGAFRSTDKGQHWSNIAGIPHGGVQRFVFQDGKMFVGCVEGIYYSANGGSNWDSFKPPFSLVNWLFVDNEFVFAGTYGGIYRTADYGATWSDINNGINGLTIYCITSDSNFMYAGSYSAGMFKSVDGLNWERIQDTLIRSDVKTIVINDDDIFIGTWEGGLLKSTNHGDSWTHCDNGIKPNSSIYSIAVNGNELFAGSSGSGIYYSSDYGQNWKNRSFGLTNLYVKTLKIIDTMILAGTYEGLFYCPLDDTVWSKVEDPDLSNYVSYLVMKDNKLFACSDSSVIISEDGGFSWNKIGTGYPGDYIYALYAGQDYLWTSFEYFPVYFSSDLGETWSDYGLGLEGIEVSNFYEKDGFIYAGTDYHGIWRRLLPEIVSINKTDELNPSLYFLSQNYPNPFNPATLITYNLPTGIHVSLKVFDVLGNEICILVDEYEAAGRHQINFTGMALTSGVYFYQLKAGEYSSTKKMMLLK